MQRHTTLAGEARTASACRYKWSGHGEIAVSVLGYEPPDLNSHSSRPRKDVNTKCGNRRNLVPYVSPVPQKFCGTSNKSWFWRNFITLYHSTLRPDWDRPQHHRAPLALWYNHTPSMAAHLPYQQVELGQSIPKSKESCNIAKKANRICSSLIQISAHGINFPPPKLHFRFN